MVAFGNEMEILGEWDDGGMCPYQAFLPVECRGIRYTIYVRERGDWYSCDVYYGIHDLLTSGGVSKIHHLVIPDEEVPLKYWGNANLFDLFTYEEVQKCDDLLELAERKARIFFQTAQHLPYRVDEKK